MSQGSFDNGAADYAELAAHVTRHIAEAALKRIPPLISGSRVLDLACGSGEVTSLIIQSALSAGHNPLPTVLGLDIAQGMVKLYQEKADANGWDTVSSKVGDAERLEGVPDEHFDLVFMNFGIMYVPDAVSCTREVYRVLKPGGYAVFTTWKQGGVQQLVGRATEAVGAPRFRSPMDNDWDTKEKLKLTVHGGGFSLENTQVVVEKTCFDRGNADGIVQALSAAFWNPLHDGTSDATLRWQKALRESLTPAEEATGSVDMISWVCFARKK